MSRAYDERIYLDENNIYEREFLENEQRFWKVREIHERILYTSLIQEYDSYIDTAKKLVNDIVPIKDDIIIINIIMHLIRNGVFSYKSIFEDKSPCIDILKSKLGLNILDGYGCCRHFSAFINDIMPESTPLTCVGYADNPFLSEANHVINKINYCGHIYGFDAFNNALFEYVSEFDMKQIHANEDMILYYKPYAEIIFYKRTFEEIKNFLIQIKENGCKNITSEILKTIQSYTRVKVYMSKDLIQDFKSDTKEQMKNIKEQIEEMCIRKK